MQRPEAPSTRSPTSSPLLGTALASREEAHRLTLATAPEVSEGEDG